MPAFQHALTASRVWVLFLVPATLQHATPRCAHECARTRCTTVLSVIRIVGTSNVVCVLPVCVIASHCKRQALGHSHPHDHDPRLMCVSLSVGRSEVRLPSSSEVCSLCSLGWVPLWPPRWRRRAVQVSMSRTVLARCSGVCVRALACHVTSAPPALSLTEWHSP